MGRAPSTRALVALVLVLGACTTANPSATPTPAPTRDTNALNVTALLDLSGSRAPNGGPQRDALQLWADQHASVTPRVKLKIVDVASSPSKTALEIRRAAIEDRADAIVVGVSVDYNDALSAAVQLAHVPVLFTLPVAEPAVASGGWAFALAPTPADLAKAALDDAQRNLDLTTVRAPLAGVATQVDQIQLGRFIAAGTPVFSVIDISNPWVDANPKESDFTYVAVGQPVTIDVDAFPDHVFRGTVGSLSPGTGAQFAILPPQNATGNFVKVVQRVPVRIYFDRNDKFVRKLKAGMSVYATIDTNHRRSLSALLGLSPAVANQDHE